MKLKASDFVFKALGILLLAAAILKGHDLLTTPVANKDIWSWRPFLIFQVESELALGIWLLSGVFKRLAWLASVVCFCLFCGVTLYKGISGAASCGCFGSVHVNPWITLSFVDLPAVIVLVVFRPQHVFTRLNCSLALAKRLIKLSLPVSRRGNLHLLLFKRTLQPLFSPKSATAVVVLAMMVCVTTPILVSNEPGQVSFQYEVLEPANWVGQELPILEHVDISGQLKEGNWLVMLYHYDCPDCAKAISEYEQMARDLAGNEDFLRIALIEVPPYGLGSVSEDSPYTLGRIDESKEWFVTTPAVMLTSQSVVKAGWEGEAPEFDSVMQALSHGFPN